MKKLITTLILVASTSLYAGTFYSNVSEVKSIDFDVDGGVVRVQLKSMKNLSECDNDERYLLNPSSRMFDEAYQLLLTAKSKGQKVEFKFRSCQDFSNKSHPKIAAVYFCNSHVCK